MNQGIEFQTGLLKISEEEWSKARLFFNDPMNNDQVKMRASEHNVPHSFFKLGDKIYALARKQYLGTGGFGKVKVVEDENGLNFAVKIEGKGPREDYESEILLMRCLGYFHGQVVRSLKEAQNLLGKLTKKKLYSVLQLKKGQDLFKILYFDLPHNIFEEPKRREPLPLSDKLRIAIKACQDIHQLHLLSFVHGDIKPQNFMVNINNEIITVSSIDFGFSMMLPEGKPIIADNFVGTPSHAAPEIFQNHKISFASDIFALGIMLKKDLQIENNFINSMTEDDPQKRPSLNDVIDFLQKQLDLIENTNESRKRTVEVLDPEKKEESSRKRKHKSKK